LTTTADPDNSAGTSSNSAEASGQAQGEMTPTTAHGRWAIESCSDAFDTPPVRARRGSRNSAPRVRW
jgi:hypothetical protein